jgi:hypothetical protein
MIQMYTEESLIRFLYNEADLFEKLELEFALEEDSTLLESYEHLNEGYASLPEIQFRPSEKTISKILAYSK